MKEKSLGKKLFKSKKIIALTTAVLVTVSVGTAVVFNDVFANEPSEEELLETVAVERQDLRRSISVTGTIASAESYTLTSDLTDVDVKKVYVKVGDRVKKGDIIAELDSSDIEISLKDAEESLSAAEEKNNLEIAAAKRNYELAKEAAEASALRSAAELQKAQQDYADAVNKSESLKNEYNGASASVTEENGNVDEVKKDIEKLKKKSRKKEAEISDLQRELDKIDEEKNRDQYNAKKDEIADCQKDLEKIKNKLEDKETALSDIQSDQSEAKSKQSEKESEAKTAEEDIKAKQEAAIKAQQAAEDAARENEKSLAEGQDSIKSSELSAASGTTESKREVNKYKRQLEKALIKAPSDGVITSVEAKEGSAYKGDVIAVLQDDSGYKVKAQVDQYDISDVENGMKAEIKTDTTGDEIMTGKVSFVSPTPAEAVSTKDNSDSNTSGSSTDYPIEAVIDEPSDRLRIGMSVKLTIIEKESVNALAVPNSAVTEDEDGNSYVEIKAVDDSSSENGESDFEIKKVTVKTGLKTDYYTEIISDELSEGSEVINSSEDEETTEAANEL
ncbi:HlyD family efflux transporter periplasmic adaptor subunit [Lachnospiraceae bacterium C1.1]|nr:HlyD family efflux transporter periplasmic adaptor subunit [Lachnospiraceae bacterium C1.1]